MTSQLSCLPREISKNQLRHVLGKMCIIVGLAERRRIHETRVAAHEFSECLLGIRLRINSKQLVVGAHFYLIAPEALQTGQKS